MINYLGEADFFFQKLFSLHTQLCPDKFDNEVSPAINKTPK